MTTAFVATMLVLTTAGLVYTLKKFYDATA